eukprot:TRINITY_DN42653_c0_g1_i1.p4 TRINITY_DN42653_c0_g1~~TRINITY_DN42653_c0_g1_i1.p4  ORF type:complete len:142 (+),score=27.22 TRINITY_DN42653_c0_g1_i1:22-426(+)
MESLLGMYDKYVNRRLGSAENCIHALQQHAGKTDERLERQEKQIQDLRAILQANQSEEAGRTYLATESWNRPVRPWEMEVNTKALVERSALVTALVAHSQPQFYGDHYRIAGFANLSKKWRLIFLGGGHRCQKG